jgi:hypothetical protein
MSLDQEKDIKDEQLKNDGKDTTIENNLKIPKEENKIDTIPEQPDETVENYNTYGTMAGLNLEHFQNEVPKKKKHSK